MWQRTPLPPCDTCASAAKSARCASIPRCRYKLPRNLQLMLWAVGLRGAVAYGLVINLPRGDTPGETGIPAIETATLFIVVVTTLGLGSATGEAGSSRTWWGSRPKGLEGQACCQRCGNRRQCGDFRSPTCFVPAFTPSLTVGVLQTNLPTGPLLRRLELEGKDDAALYGMAWEEGGLTQSMAGRPPTRVEVSEHSALHERFKVCSGSLRAWNWLCRGARPAWGLGCHPLLQPPDCVIPPPAGI